MAKASKVEAQSVAVEVSSELTQDEERERHRLELRVERAFYEAGAALRELCNRRLYRNTHKSWEDYCRDRFGYTPRKAYYLIGAADVIDNLSRREQIVHILPTKENQCRPLAQLKPEEQVGIWQEAVEKAGGKVPSERIVKGIAERLLERDATPPPIPYSQGDVVMIRGMGNPDLRKFDGRWAITLRINEYTVTLALDGKDVPVKPQFLEPVDPKYWAEIKAVNERITRLQLECDLDPMDDVALEFLRRRTYFTQRQMLLLERIEQDYVLTDVRGRPIC